MLGLIISNLVSKTGVLISAKRGVYPMPSKGYSLYTPYTPWRMSSLSGGYGMMGLDDGYGMIDVW